jgi:hypothetical protein
MAIGKFVERFNESDRLEVFAPTINVGDSLALIARIIEIQHRGDRIYTQPISMIIKQPVQRAGGEKIANFPHGHN